MKIIIFGATGRVGSCMVEQAVEAGHEVTAFVRDPSRLKAGTEKITVVQGDVLDLNAVRSALEPDFDAVLYAIGATVLKPSTVVADGARSVIAGMEANGIKRFLGVSGTAEMPNQTFFGRINTAILRLTPVGHPVRDHDTAFEEIKASNLTWMLAACPYIKDGPRRGTYKVRLAFPGGFKTINPPDVADFLIKELSEDKYAGKVVGVWY